jgi:hypothetical protein
MQSIAEKKLEPGLNEFFGFTGCDLVSVNALVCAGWRETWETKRGLLD